MFDMFALQLHGLFQEQNNGNGEQKQCNAKTRGGKTDCKSMAHHAQEGHFPRSGQLTFEGCCTKAPVEGSNDARTERAYFLDHSYQYCNGKLGEWDISLHCQPSIHNPSQVLHSSQRTHWIPPRKTYYWVS